MAKFAENRKARFDYEILEKYDAGIELLGFEVKAIRAGKISLVGSFIIIRGKEVFLMNAHIDPYQPKNTPKDYDPLRVRKLLLTKKEIEEISKEEHSRNLTIVPISMYNKNGKIKVELALVRGKKTRDKREVIKRRETDRAIRREFKRGN